MFSERRILSVRFATDSPPFRWVPGLALNQDRWRAKIPQWAEPWPPARRDGEANEAKRICRLPAALH